MTPTPAGEALVRRARLVFQQLQRMRAELGDHAQGLKGTVRLQCNTAALSEYLPDALAGFLARHPHVDVAPFHTDRLVAVATPDLAQQLAPDGRPVPFVRLADFDHVSLAGDSALFNYLELQALRQLSICVKSFDALPRHAQQLVDALGA